MRSSYEYMNYLQVVQVLRRTTGWLIRNRREQALRQKLLTAASHAGRLSWVGSKAVTPEQMEISGLRAENVRLKREAVILKKLRRTSRVN